TENGENKHGQGTAFDPSSLRCLHCCRGRRRAFVSGGSNGLRVDVAEARGPYLANEVTAHRNVHSFGVCRLESIAAPPEIACACQQEGNASSFNWRMLSPARKSHGVRGCQSKTVNL